MNLLKKLKSKLDTQVGLLSLMGLIVASFVAFEKYDCSTHIVSSLAGKPYEEVKEYIEKEKSESLLARYDLDTNGVIDSVEVLQYGRDYRRSLFH